MFPYIIILSLVLVISPSNSYFTSKISPKDMEFGLVDSDYWKDEVEIALGPLQNQADQLTYFLTRIIEKCEELVEIYPFLNIVIDPFITILVTIVKPFTSGIVKWSAAVMDIQNQIDHDNFTFLLN